MANADKAALYRQWVELLGWLEAEAQARGLNIDKVADFPDYIYRMERPYDLPTTIMSVSVSQGGQALLVAAVSPRHVNLGGVSLRLMGGSKHWHLHAGEGALAFEQATFTRERLGVLLDGVMQGKGTLAV